MPAKPKPSNRRWFVRIDNWQPTLLNKLIRCHWAERNRLTRFDAEVLRCCLLGADVPAADGPRRVALEILLGPRQRGADPDAYWKSLLDGLVKAGALVDDSPSWCLLGGVTFGRGAVPGTIVKIEEYRRRGVLESTAAVMRDERRQFTAGRSRRRRK